MTFRDVEFRWPRVDAAVAGMRVERSFAQALPALFVRPAELAAGAMILANTVRI